MSILFLNKWVLFHKNVHNYVQLSLGCMWIKVWRVYLNKNTINLLRKLYGLKNIDFSTISWQKRIFETIRKWIKDSRSSSGPEISSQLNLRRKRRNSNLRNVLTLHGRPQIFLPEEDKIFQGGQKHTICLKKSPKQILFSSKKGKNILFWSARVGWGQGPS